MKIIHKANLIRKDGAVSPLCAIQPRAINLKRASWTLSDNYVVTCKKCLKKMEERKGWYEEF